MHDGQCYRKNPAHFAEYSHPVQFPEKQPHTPPQLAPVTPVAAQTFSLVAPPAVAASQQGQELKRRRSPTPPAHIESPPHTTTEETLGDLGSIRLANGTMALGAIPVDQFVGDARKMLEAMYLLTFPENLVREMLAVLNACVTHYNAFPSSGSVKVCVDFGPLSAIRGITLVGPFEALYLRFYVSGTKAVYLGQWDTTLFTHDAHKWVHWRFKTDPAEMQTIIVPTSLVKAVASSPSKAPFSNCSFAVVNVGGSEVDSKDNNGSRVLLPHNVTHISLWRDDPMNSAVRCKRSVSSPVQPGITEAYIRKEDPKGGGFPTFDHRLRPCGTSLGPYLLYLVGYLIQQFQGDAAAVGSLTKVQATLTQSLKSVDPSSAEALKSADIAAAKAHRHKHVLGSLFSGMSGVIIPYDSKTDIGYRPPNLAQEKLRQYCFRINDWEAKSKPGGEALIPRGPQLNTKEREEFDREMQFVDISNDECDFGMGLETGMNMWHCARFDPAPTQTTTIPPSNCGLILRSAVRILTLAYALLNRDTLAHIIRCHVKAFCSPESEAYQVGTATPNTTPLHVVVARSGPLFSAALV